jgi:predicted AAA+ superfamily ATPase
MEDGPYIPRHVDQTLDALLAELPAVMLTGPRGCGKTTTALRRARSVLRLDRPEVAEAFRGSPDAILAAQEPPVVIDEWQEAPEAVGAVKRAVDGGRGAGGFLITGSVRARRAAASWPGTGRIVPVPMWGLTVGERERGAGAAEVVGQLFGPEDPVIGTLDQAPGLADYVDAIVRGGFPGAVGLPDVARGPWYEGYVEELIHRDVLELEEVRTPEGLARLVGALALNTAGTPAVASLAEFSDLDRRTVGRLLALLEDLRVLERLPAWSRGKTARLVKTPKYHLTDPGMAAHLAGDSRAGVMTDGNRLGRLVETFAVAQLRPFLTSRWPRITALHLREAGGRHEIDLVLESATGRVVGIEVKAGAVVAPKAARHLEWFRDLLGDAFVRGYVLHTGTMTFPLAERVWAMPLARLWRGSR